MESDGTYDRNDGTRGWGDINEFIFRSGLWTSRMDALVLRARIVEPKYPLHTLERLGRLVEPGGIRRTPIPKADTAYIQPDREQLRILNLILHRDQLFDVPIDPDELGDPMN